MKTKNAALYPSLGLATFAGAVMLMASSAQAQNLFVANYADGNIYEYTSAGVPSVFATGMDYPSAIAFDSAGDMFVADSNNNSPGGYITEFSAGGGESTFATGVDPQALAFNSAGDLFEADYWSGNIYEFTPTGQQSTFATGFSFPTSLAFDSSGNLFVGAGYGNGNGYIEKITPNGNQSSFATGLSFPEGLTFNSAGDLYEGDTAGYVYEFATNGVQTTVGAVSEPDGIALDSSGDLFVTAHQGSIIEIAPGGGETTFATESPVPTAIAFGPVPEPPVFALLGLGAVALLKYRRK